MSQPLLSILIPTTPDRIEGMKDLLFTLGRGRMFQELKNALHSIGDTFIARDVYIYPDKTEVEVIVYCDDKKLTIGEKRERLYRRADGIMSWQIDSDDLVSDDAIDLIISAIKSNPEISCITFRENCIMNGEYKSSNHSLRYSQWMDNQDGFDYVRSPFYKDVIRTDIAQSVPFEHIRYNEDERWSKALYSHLKDEIHIDKELYFYIYEPKETHEERYGLNRD